MSPTERGQAISQAAKELPQLESSCSISRGGKGPGICPTGKGPFHIPNQKEASPYPQMESGKSISPMGKGLVHILNGKGAGLYPPP